VWCGGLLWLVVSAVVYRCDLMRRLIKLHTRGCVGSQIRLAGCVSIGKYVAQWCNVEKNLVSQYLDLLFPKHLTRVVNNVSMK